MNIYKDENDLIGAIEYFKCFNEGFRNYCLP